MKSFPTALIIILLTGLLACNSQKNGKAINPVELAQIEAVPNDFFQALGSGDTTLLTNLLTPDFYMFEHDAYWTADSLLKLMPLTLGRVWQVNDLKVDQENGLIHISYFNNSLNPIGRSWYESMLITNTKEGLKIKFMHSTKLYLK